ncbi:unnamed protein product [Microthlaspi erraticum]|uniref:Ataxin-2 C-terminal domain-containing protein n=1 Tax=Microthlaspi erraticum TaxID=1685480 RepID=A0A6D2K4Q3_9BRAS|nr:unnamed protein product [Microthlaspi erraticum]
MASEGGTRANVNDPAKTTGEEEKRTEEDDLAKSNDEGEVKTGDDDPAKITGEEEKRTEEDDLAKTDGEEEAKAEEADLDKTADEEEARAEEAEPEKETFMSALDFDTFDAAFKLTMAEDEPSGGSGSRQQVSVTNNSPRSLNAAAAPWRPNQIARPVIQEPAFADHNYGFGMPQQHYHPNAGAPMMYEQYRGPAPMWPGMYNHPQQPIVPHVVLVPAPMIPMMYNQPQEQFGQAPMMPMMYNQPQEQFGQAPVRPMGYNNQQQQVYQGGQHFGFPNNAAAAPRPEMDQEMQQLQHQMQQPAASQGSNSGPTSGQRQD